MSATRATAAAAAAAAQDTATSRRVADWLSLFMSLRLWQSTKRGHSINVTSAAIHGEFLPAICRKVGVSGKMDYTVIHRSQTTGSISFFPKNATQWHSVRLGEKLS
jgi:hypothetical protein